MGDFNAKIEKLKNGAETAKKTDKGGRQLMTMVERNKLEIVNGMDITKGKWTRIQGDTKSALDYLIVEEKESESVISMIIDEEKMETPYYVTDENEEKYTDHTAMICKMKWDNSVKTTAKKRCITEEGYKKFAEMIKDKRPSKQIGDGSLQRVYDAWNEEVMKIKEKCMTTIKNKQNNSKTVKNLMRIKRRMRKNPKTPQYTMRKKQLQLNKSRD